MTGPAGVVGRASAHPALPRKGDARDAIRRRPGAPDQVRCARPLLSTFVNSMLPVLTWLTKAATRDGVAAVDPPKRPGTLVAVIARIAKD